MKRLALTVIAALTLGGCSTGYKWTTDKEGNVYLAGTYQRYDADKAAAIGNEIQSGVGRFARGASNGYDQYQWSHANVVQQHGAMTGYVGGQSVWVNY